MNATGILVNVGGISLMGWIVWYFWMWKPSISSANEMEGNGTEEIEITVKGGYQPSAVMVKAGKPLRLLVTRKEPSTCGEEMILSDFGKRVHLPEGQTVTLELLPDKVGEFAFHCPMGMYRGKLIVQG